MDVFLSIESGGFHSRHPMTMLFHCPELEVASSKLLLSHGNQTFRDFSPDRTVCAGSGVSSQLNAKLLSNLIFHLIDCLSSTSHQQLIRTASAILLCHVFFTSLALLSIACVGSNQPMHRKIWYSSRFPSSVVFLHHHRFFVNGKYVFHSKMLFLYISLLCLPFYFSQEG